MDGLDYGGRDMSYKFLPVAQRQTFPHAFMVTKGAEALADL